MDDGFGVAAHADFVERERDDHDVEHFERIGEKLAAFGSSGGGKLAHDGIVEAAAAIAKATRQEFVHGCRIEATEEADYCGGFRGRVVLQRFLQVTHARSAHGFGEMDDAFAFGAARGSRQAHGKMFGRALRHAHQHADQTIRHGFGDHGLFDEFGNAIIHADARTQSLHPAGARAFQVGERIEGLLHGAIVTARGGFLAEADERGAEKRLQLGVFFRSHGQADLGDGVLQTLAGGFAVELGELSQADRGFLAGLGVGVADAGCVVQQDVSGGVRFAASHEFFDVLLNVARRNAPRFRRHQHGFLAGVRDGGPELAIENVGMRFHGHAGVRQFFFA